MPQSVSVITLGVADLAASRRFYVEGFGWTPVFENDELIFYQLNGLMLGTWLSDKLREDVRFDASGGGAMTVAHNVRAEDDVQPLIDRLANAGGSVLRPADAPPHGGKRGYVGDPDGHVWEIAWNPAWPMDADGNVVFGV